MSDTVTEAPETTTEVENGLDAKPETEETPEPEATPAAETPADETTDTPTPKAEADDSEPEAAATMPDSLLKVGEKDKEKGEAEKTELAEPYDAFELPDGIKLNEGALEAMTPGLRAMKMDQKTVEGLSAVLGKAMEADVEQNKLDQIKLNDGWIDQLKAHPEFGGEGEIGESHFKSSVALANKAANAFGDVGLNFAKTLVQYGIENEPSVMMFMKALGGKVGESNLVTAGEQTRPTKSDEELFYGGTMKTK